MKRIFSGISLLLCFVFLALAVSQTVSRFFPRRWNQDYSRITNQTSTPHTPVRLRIAKLGIDLPVDQTKRMGNSWEVSDRGISYFNSSVLPGEVGAGIFYAHNWSNLLGSLPQVKKGAEVEIFFADGVKLDFIIQNTQVVDAEYKLSLSEPDKKLILIYTCTGFLDAQRFIAQAILSEKSP